jgi:TatD DNase family protein
MNFPEKNSFINIHSHKTSYSESEFALLNIFAQEYKTYKINYEYAYSVGLHPWHVKKDLIKPALDAIEDAAKESFVVAIGETGLDRATEIELKLQEEVFISQLEIAERSKKPVMLHAVRSYSDMIAIRKKNHFTTPWIFHGYTGNYIIARQLMDLNCYLSFGKFLFNSKSNVPDLFIELPKEYMFLEIDDSNLTIQEVYRHASFLKACDIREMQQTILNNFNRCFFDGKNR